MVALEPMAPEMLSSEPSLRKMGTAVFAQAKPNPYGMEPAFTRKLQTAPVDEYRHNYARFRKGKAQGAKGERPGATVTADEMQVSLEEEEKERVYHVLAYSGTTSSMSSP